MIWDEKDERKWYVAICRKRLNQQQFLVEHLQRVSKDHTKRCWKYPSKPEEQTVILDQIIPVNVLGSWNLQGRSSVLNLIRIQN